MIETQAPEQATELRTVRASEITPREVKWLWYPYIPFGKVTLLQGDPGDGKSQFALTLAALLSRGEPPPFAGPEAALPPLTVIYQTTEDDTDDTVVPRFIAANGNRENLVFIREDEQKLTFGDDRIRRAILLHNAKLLILDPMSAYIGDGCSLNAANETRAAFNHLITVARETDCAILIIAHMNKARDSSPLYRTSGSIDIAGSARSILAITRTTNEENPNERLMVQVKSNLAPTGSGILFEVGEKGVTFLDELEISAEQALSKPKARIGRPSEKVEQATALIKAMLKSGRMPASDCEAKLEAAGYKKSTIKKAKRNAGVVSEKGGVIWYWSPPSDKEYADDWCRDAAPEELLPL